MKKTDNSDKSSSNINKKLDDTSDDSQTKGKKKSGKPESYQDINLEDGTIPSPKRSNKKEQSVQLIPPEKQKIILEKKQEIRREQRLRDQKLTRQQLHRQRRKEQKKYHDFDNEHDDESSEIAQEKENLTDIHFGKNSNNQQNNQNQDDNDDNNNDNIGFYKSDELIEKSNNSDLNIIKNTQNYLKFIKNFVNQIDILDENQMTIQKAMVSDTITQMFDQFMMGMNHFPRQTKQHQIFGRGAHLCQKILLSLKDNNLNEAKSLMSKIIPKR